jgi:hypothetical protein
VSQKQDWLSAASAGEINLQVIAKIPDAMKLCVPAQPFESSGKQCPQPVHSVLVVARRLDLHELMNSLNQLVSSFLEVTKPLRYFALGNGSSLGWL